MSKKNAHFSAFRVHVMGTSQLVSIINVDAPAFAAVADALSAAGPSPITMMSHASTYSTSGGVTEEWACHK